MGDALFPVYNNFFIGNYQVCINEAYELSNLSGTDAIERDCYLYRSHIALGHCQLVIDEINDDATTALQAVKCLATYKSRELEREQCVATINEWLADDIVRAIPTVQLVAALILADEGNTVEALKCCHTGLSLELMGLMIHLLVKMDRPELAEKHLRVMQAADDDATLTQLATAWVNLAQGGVRSRTRSTSTRSSATSTAGRPSFTTAARCARWRWGGTMTPRRTWWRRFNATARIRIRSRTSRFARCTSASR